jgi:hypothetical protein
VPSATSTPIEISPSADILRNSLINLAARYFIYIREWFPSENAQDDASRELSYAEAIGVRVRARGEDESGDRYGIDARHPTYHVLPSILLRSATS